MKKLTKAQWGAKGIHNPYNIAQKASGFILYFIPRRTGRASKAACWQVVRVGYQTDPNGHWMDNGHKTFPIFGATKQEAFEAAREWANAKYGLSEWERDPWGSWHPKGDMEKASQS